MVTKLHIVVVAAIIAAAVLAVGSFAPLPGYYNVSTAVTMEVTSISFLTGQIAAYGINGVSPSTTGNSAVLDWSALCFICTSFITSSLSLKVCVGTHCNTISETKFNSIADVEIGYTVTDSVTVGYVPAGTYSVTATLYSSGSVAATGSGSVTVGGYISGW